MSSGDFVGSLPVGMQSRGITDLPYWPSQNMYVYKEVWVHPVSRWLWLMADLTGTGLAEARTKRSVDFSVTTAKMASGELAITVRASGSGTHTFSIRSDNLTIVQPEKRLVLRGGKPGVLRWNARIRSANTPWVAVIIPDGNVDQRREVFH